MSLIAITCMVIIVFGCLVYIPRLITNERINKIKNFFKDEPTDLDIIVDEAKDLRTKAQYEIAKEEQTVARRRQKVDELNN